MCLADRKCAGTEVALVTGCGAGIGKALALELNQLRRPDGQPAYDVIATDADYEALSPLAKEGISTAQLDVTDVNSINAVVSNILLEKGRIDLLVCTPEYCYTGWMAELDYNEVERMFNVNVHGVFKTVQAVAPHMMDHLAGKIAIVCSINSWVARPFEGPLSGANAALSMYTDALHQELFAHDILVMKIVPGLVKGDTSVNYKALVNKYYTPKSKYQSCTDYLYSMYNKLPGMGITMEQAGKQLAKGLFHARGQLWQFDATFVIRVGDSFSFRWAVFKGYVQQWTPGGVDRAANFFLAKSGLSDLQKRLQSLPG